MSDAPHPHPDANDPVKSPTLNYASPRTPKPDAIGRLVIGLLITFLALVAGFFAIVIYMSRVG